MEIVEPSQETTQHSIYRAPRHLRDVNNKAFEPRIVAIGPYYYGQPEFKRMEEVKLLYMQRLLKVKPQVYYILGIKEESKRARNCYEESSINLNDDEFTDMLVLDGCFIIQVIKYPKLFFDAFPDRSRLRILQRDLMLLENQIPLFVLCKLFNLIHESQQHNSFTENVLNFYRDVFPRGALYGSIPEMRSEEVQHILDLLHSNCCPPHIFRSDYDETLEKEEPVGWCGPINTSSSGTVIPSASELKGANVKFCNKDYNYARNSEDQFVSLFDVEFNDDSGKMLMPTLRFDDWTESMLRNFIAYEQLFRNGRPAFFVDYIVLLDGLINTPKDVQILCGANIIENLLGSEEAVAELVNKLGKGVMVIDFRYENTFRRINDYHKKPWNRAVAALRRDYFNTPWAYIAFLAALTLLLLTAAQTIFSLLQVLG